MEQNCRELFPKSRFADIVKLKEWQEQVYKCYLKLVYSESQSEQARASFVTMNTVWTGMNTAAIKWYHRGFCREAYMLLICSNTPQYLSFLDKSTCIRLSLWTKSRARRLFTDPKLRKWLKIVHWREVKKHLLELVERFWRQHLQTYGCLHENM